MKKVSLKNLKEHLSRDEMKQITGGSGSGSAFCRCLNGNDEGVFHPNCSWCHQRCYGGPFICVG